MVSFTLDAVKFLLIYRHLQNIYWFMRENCQLTNLQLFQIILILPFMAVPGFSHYAGSSISKLFGGKKDLLYSFMAKDNID